MFLRNLPGLQTLVARSDIRRRSHFFLPAFSVLMPSLIVASASFSLPFQLRCSVAVENSGIPRFFGVISNARR